MNNSKHLISARWAHMIVADWPYLIVTMAVASVLTWIILAHGDAHADQEPPPCAAAEIVDDRTPLYCERFPDQCKRCEEPPCGEPLGLVCCEEPLGCFGVHAYSDCEGSLYSCEYGYQGRNEDGSYYVVCFDT